jgi:hypothetical protein
MKEAQKHQSGSDRSELTEIWFRIEKDADGYPETKSWEGMLSQVEGKNFRIVSIPFYLKNVSRGDLVSATEGEFLQFSHVVTRGGHNTYRLLLKQTLPDGPSRTVGELTKMELGVEEEHGFFFAVDVPPSVDQTATDAFFVEQTQLGRWEMQDGFLCNIT